MMKRFLIYGVAVLAVLAAAAIGLAKEEGRHGRGREKMESGRHGFADANVHDANRPRHHMQDANGPRLHRKMAMMWRRAFRERMERLVSIREIASQEGATKTVAALDELIAEEKGRLEKMKKRMRSMQKRRASGEGEEGEAKGKGEGKYRGRGRRGKSDTEAEDQQ